MNKAPRFVREYANYQKKFAKTLPNKEYGMGAIKKIDKYVSALDNGFITVDEAMFAINNCFK